MDYAAQTAILLKGLFPKLLEGFTVTLSVGLASIALALVLSRASARRRACPRAG